MINTTNITDAQAVINATEMTLKNIEMIGNIIPTLLVLFVVIAIIGTLIATIVRMFEPVNLASFSAYDKPDKKEPPRKQTYLEYVRERREAERLLRK